MECTYVCDELQRKWKKAVGYLKYYSEISLEGLRREMKNL
jgi:hypothetical protein